MKNGLEDVIAAETQLSDVDGEAGRLIIRGVSLDHLVAGGTYEGVAALLLDGLMERSFDQAELRGWLAQARTNVFVHIEAADAALLALPPVDAMRALIARLPDGDDFDTALALLAAPAVFLPAILRLQRDQKPIAPDVALSQAADILRMLTGNCRARSRSRRSIPISSRSQTTASTPRPSHRGSSPRHRPASPLPCWRR